MGDSVTEVAAATFRESAAVAQSSVPTPRGCFCGDGPFWRRRRRSSSQATPMQHSAASTAAATATPMRPARGRGVPGVGEGPSEEPGALMRLGEPTKAASAAAASPPNVSGCASTNDRSHPEPTLEMAEGSRAAGGPPPVRATMTTETVTVLGSAGGGDADADAC